MCVCVCDRVGERSMWSHGSYGYVCVCAEGYEWMLHVCECAQRGTGNERGGRKRWRMERRRSVARRRERRVMRQCQHVWVTSWRCQGCGAAGVDGSWFVYRAGRYDWLFGSWRWGKRGLEWPPHRSGERACGCAKLRLRVAVRAAACGRPTTRKTPPCTTVPCRFVGLACAHLSARRMPRSWQGWASNNERRCEC